MELTEITQLISSVGFPIVVAGYLLVFQERLLRRLVQAIEGLQQQIQTNQAALIQLIITHLNTQQQVNQAVNQAALSQQTHELKGGLTT